MCVCMCIYIYYMYVYLYVYLYMCVCVLIMFWKEGHAAILRPLLRLRIISFGPSSLPSMSPRAF